MTHTARRAAIAALTALAAVAAIIAADLAPPASAQSDESRGRSSTQRIAENCVIHPNGKIECWGETDDTPTPLGNTAVAVSAEWRHTCDVRSGAIDCWGVVRANRPADGYTIVSEYTCAIRANREIECRGDGHARLIAASTGDHTAVSAGFWQRCTFRESGALECWGINELPDAPIAMSQPASAQSDAGNAGRIVARLLDDGRVEFGWQPRSGARVLPRLRYFPTDATVDRWLRSSPVEVGGTAIGRINARRLSDGRIESAFTRTGSWRIPTYTRYFLTHAPVGRWLPGVPIRISAPSFTAISAGAHYTCGLHGTGAIECWGNNRFGQADAPAGSFTAVSAGQYHTCGLHDTGAIECWGWNEHGQTDAPPGDFTAVSAGFGHTCAIRDTKDLACWGWNEYKQTDAPDGSYSAISAGRAISCGLRDTGEITCWGDTAHWQTHPPAGVFAAISAGDHTCGLRSDGAIECWGGRSYARAGRFRAVVGRVQTCGLRESGEIECWGVPLDGALPPAGRFTAVSASHVEICGLRPSGEIECRGGGFSPRHDDY